MIARLAQSGLVHVLFAFLMMGSWAVYANWNHPMPKPLIAGLLQGALSGAITYALKRTLDFLRGRMAHSKGWWLPPMIALSVSFCLLVTAHLAAGTPELFRTISLPFSVASLYALSYNFIMWRRAP
jgi:uncharacterized transporter YbjL